MTNPVAEARDRAWLDAAEDAWQLKDDELFEAGWDAAVQYLSAVHHAEKHQLVLLIEQQRKLIDAYETIHRDRR